MNRPVSRLVVATLAASAAFAHAQQMEPAAQDATQGKRVLITYHNLTAGQAFSPGVFFSHNTAAPPLFTEGQPAPFALQRLAEEGNTGPLATKTTKVSGGAFFYTTLAPSLQPGATRSVRLTVTQEHPLVTGAFMLAHTNDGFTGIQSVDAYSLTEPMEIDLFAYDAGSENNNELGDYLIAMEGTARDPENGVVRRHEGLRGDADAPGFWKFDPALPVAHLTITPER
ncbi:MAG: spondin domain-containing protein [Povalibacter sp.]